MFTEILNQIEQSMEEAGASLPEQNPLQQANMTAQEMTLDLNMADSSNKLPQQTPPQSPQAQSAKSIARVQTLQARRLDQGNLDAESVETWGTTQLYQLI